MTALSIAFEAPAAPHCRTPSKARPIDLVHLATQTSGDKGREVEALQAFLRQARQALRDVATGDADGIVAAAHRLQGSAESIGAFKVAEAATRLEANAADAASMAMLGAAVLESENFILKLCR